MSDVHVLMREAIQRRQREDFEGAKAVLFDCIAKHPQVEWPRIELSNIFATDRDISGQEQVLVEGIATLSRAPLLKALLGDLRHRQGRRDDAEQFLMASLADGPNAKAYAGLLKIEIAEGRYADAEKLASDALGHFSTKERQWAFLIEYCGIVGASLAGNVNVDALPKAGRAIENSVVVSMLKDEGDIIEQQLERCYLVGLRKFAILDNMSTDNTIEKIRKFQSSHADVRMVVADDPCKAYFQSEKTTFIAEYAVKYFGLFGESIDWVFPLDADEFLVVSPDGPDLADILESAINDGKTVLSFLLNNAATCEVMQRLPASFDPDEMFPLKAEFGERPVVKVAFRPKPGFNIAQGNHAVFGVVEAGSQVLHMAQHGAFLRHYPNRSVEQMRSKFTNGALALHASPNIAGGSHWRGNFDRLKQEGDPFLIKLLSAQIVQYRKRYS